MAALAHPQQIPLDLNVLGTRKGAWLIRVHAVMAAEDSDNLSLQLLLQNLEEDKTGETRHLYAVIAASDLEIPQRRVLIADHIRQWVENTEGNGFLNLASTVALFPG